MTARKQPEATKPLDFALMQKGVEDAMRALAPRSPLDEVPEYDISGAAEAYVYIRCDWLRDAKPLTETQIKSRLFKINKQSQALLMSLMTLEEMAGDVLYQTSAKSDRSPQIGPPFPASMMKLYPRRPTIGEMMVYLRRLAVCRRHPRRPQTA